MVEIANAELLTNIFGRWPNFHDAEVVTMLLDRRGELGPCLTAQIHLWNMTPEVDATGHFILKDHTLATIRFDGIVLEHLASFGHQNVLFELLVRDVSEEPISADQYFPEYVKQAGIRVDFETSYGCHASFACSGIRVLTALPCSEEGDTLPT